MMLELEPLSAGREEALFAQIAARTIDGALCGYRVYRGCGQVWEHGREGWVWLCKDELAFWSRHH